ncbi:hypothetical protein HanRHA438_Chr01g0043411 [Helianthus annuus]|nr:hypothetical protein HanRHA438_Chr01g0043411 [Helianthus annuus]
MFTEVFYKLSKCVCEFWAECSLSFYLSGVWEWQNSRTPELTHTQHMHGYIYPAQHVWSKDSKDGPKDHLSDTMLSKDKQGPRRIVFRGLSFEAYLSMRSKDPNYPSILYIILRSEHLSTYNLLSKSNRRMVDLVNLQHKSGHRYIRPNTDKVQTQVHQQQEVAISTHLRLNGSICVMFLSLTGQTSKTIK